MPIINAKVNANSNAKAKAYRRLPTPSLCTFATSTMPPCQCAATIGDTNAPLTRLSMTPQHKNATLTMPQPQLSLTPHQPVSSGAAVIPPLLLTPLHRRCPFNAGMPWMCHHQCPAIAVAVHPCKCAANFCVGMGQLPNFLVGYVDVWFSS
jgi:hypothetical protein